MGQLNQLTYILWLTNIVGTNMTRHFEVDIAIHHSSTFDFFHQIVFYKATCQLNQLKTISSPTNLEETKTAQHIIHK